MKIAILGLGEVGRCYASGLSRDDTIDLVFCELRMSPAALDLAEKAGAPVYDVPGSWLADVDWVFSCVLGSTAFMVANDCFQFMRPSARFADFTTAPAAHKRRAASQARHKSLYYIDVAIVGAIAAAGIRTPLLCAGPQTDEFVALVSSFESPARALSGGEPGDAISLKFIRSVITKGLEALAVEALLAAERQGLRCALYEVLSDIDQTPFTQFLEMLARTHVVHATRRLHEVEEAERQLHTAGSGSDVLPGVRERFAHTARRVAGLNFPAGIPTIGQALALLSEPQATSDRKTNMTINQDHMETLKQLGTATIHEAQGQKGALDGRLRALDPSCRLAGPALTVDCRPSDNLAIHYALTKAKPGDVLVVDAKGFMEAGPWGDVLTLAAQKLGVAGLVIYGSVRDANSMIEMGFPVFSLGLSIKGTNKNQPGRINIPVTIGDVTINPGDIIVGDRDGLVVVDKNEVADVISASQAREEKEAGFRAELNVGKTTVELLNLKETLEKFGMT